MFRYRIKITKIIVLSYCKWVYTHPVNSNFTLWQYFLVLSYKVGFFLIQGIKFCQKKTHHTVLAIFVITFVSLFTMIMTECIWQYTPSSSKWIYPNFDICHFKCIVLFCVCVIYVNKCTQRNFLIGQFRICLLKSLMIFKHYLALLFSRCFCFCFHLSKTENGCLFAVNREWLHLIYPSP